MRSSGVMNCQPRVFSALARHGPRAPASAARNRQMAARTDFSSCCVTGCLQSDLAHLKPPAVDAVPSRSTADSIAGKPHRRSRNGLRTIIVMPTGERTGRRGTTSTVLMMDAPVVAIPGTGGRRTHASASAAKKRLLNQSDTVTSPIITGTSTSGPMTAAKAAPELIP